MPTGDVHLPHGLRFEGRLHRATAHAELPGFRDERFRVVRLVSEATGSAARVARRLEDAGDGWRGFGRSPSGARGGRVGLAARPPL